MAEQETVDYNTMSADDYRTLRAAGPVPPQSDATDTTDDTAEPEDTPEEILADSAPAVDDTDEEEADEASQEDQADNKPRRQPVQKRINALTKRTKEAEQRAVDERNARLAVEARLLALEREKQTAETPPQPPSEPNPDDFDTNDAYVEALVDHKLNERIAAAQEQQAMHDRLSREQAETERLRDQYNTSVFAARETYADYDDVINATETEASELLRRALMYNEHAGHVAYHLAAHPEDLTRLNAVMSPQTMLRELARIEAYVVPDPQAAPPTPPTPRRPASPPPPLTPPTGDRGSGGRVKRPEEMTHEEYRKWRKQP